MLPNYASMFHNSSNAPMFYNSSNAPMFHNSNNAAPPMFYKINNNTPNFHISNNSPPMFQVSNHAQMFQCINNDNNEVEIYSRKVFLGGLPIDITEAEMMPMFQK
jgi:hypothetical protein